MRKLILIALLIFAPLAGNATEMDCREDLLPQLMKEAEEAKSIRLGPMLHIEKRKIRALERGNLIDVIQTCVLARELKRMRRY